MAGKSNGVDASDWARTPPTSGPLWERVCKAIYNPEDKSFLGRTPKRWGIALVFYLIFYAVLAAMFAACMGVLLMLIDEKRPMYTLESSLIGANPGVASRPSVDGSFLLDNSNTSSYDSYVDELKDFFSDYSTEEWYLSKKGCKEDDSFGYPTSPCFFIKLNRIYGWKPQYYDAKSLPTDMPHHLSEYISSLPDIEQQQIWISCVDEVSNATSYEYPWGRGLPGRFYPYQNEVGYISPVLAIKVTPPANTPITIRCRTWAKNIVYNKSLKEPSGYTRIQLYFEDNTSLNSTNTDGAEIK
ncbi:sodium/potassium-transporting ATPase subunit beta-1-like [Pieris rapae]|uniref:sodium/potassium-transporting ATPase subunit beta-1-like n=1 Tax=Pieris rapae TaxID=64459 RepID=UPI001E27B67B|nr:sodium/potassium-transporting ATPase subunit beta-1-like [Pieris rapae]